MNAQPATTAQNHDPLEALLAAGREKGMSTIETLKALHELLGKMPAKIRPITARCRHDVPLGTVCRRCTGELTTLLNRNDTNTAITRPRN